MTMDRLAGYSNLIQGQDSYRLGSVEKADQTGSLLISAPLSQIDHGEEAVSSSPSGGSLELSPLQRGNLKVQDAVRSLGGLQERSLTGLSPDNPTDSKEVHRAIDSLQRDKALRDFNYFVGSPARTQEDSNRSLVFSSRDGNVVRTGKVLESSFGSSALEDISL